MHVPARPAGCRGFSRVDQLLEDFPTIAAAHAAASVRTKRVVTNSNWKDLHFQRGTALLPYLPVMEFFENCPAATLLPVEPAWVTEAELMISIPAARNDPPLPLPHTHTHTQRKFCHPAILTLSTQFSDQRTKLGGALLPYLPVKSKGEKHPTAAPEPESEESDTESEMMTPLQTAGHTLLVPVPLSLPHTRKDALSARNPIDWAGAQ